MIKTLTNLIKSRTFIVLAFLLVFLVLVLGTLSSIKVYNQKISGLKNLHKTLLCPMSDAFSQVYRGYLNPFSGVDCSGDYPGKTAPVPTIAPLRRFQGGSEICDRFPNTPGCQ